MKTWSKDEILHYIATNDKVATNALLKLYDCQTQDEKSCGDTHNSNGRGFNAIDGQILSSIASFYIEKGFITQKQMLIVRKKLPKYIKQLVVLANEGRN